jgi:hypothetical protein
MTEKDERGSRRDFLRLASLGAAGGVAAATGASAAEVDGPAEPEAGSETGYRKTAHVAAYLDSCRF